MAGEWPPKTPYLTVDIIIELADRPERPVVLIERRNPPHGWALPGGFVDYGEQIEEAARREALEETSLVVRLTTLLGIYSAPNRDARMHTTSAVYVAEAVGTPRAADDARALRLVTLDELPPMAFDHGLILEDFRRFRTNGLLAPLRE